MYFPKKRHTSSPPREIETPASPGFLLMVGTLPLLTRCYAGSCSSNSLAGMWANHSEKGISRTSAPAARPPCGDRANLPAGPVPVPPIVPGALLVIAVHFAFPLPVLFL